MLHVRTTETQGPHTPQPYRFGTRRNVAAVAVLLTLILAAAAALIFGPARGPETTSATYA